MTSPQLAIVDIETTGPDIAGGDRIIQIAAVVVENQVIVQEYNMYINPEMEIPENIQSLTGISDEDVIHAPTFESVASLWYKRLKDAILVAHNLPFDLGFLQEKFNHYLGIDYCPLTFDTLSAAKIFLSDAPGFNLTEICHFIGVDIGDAHNALADARATTVLLAEIFEVMNQLPPAMRMQVQPFLTHLSKSYTDILANGDQYLFDATLLDAKVTYLQSGPRVFKANDTDQARAKYILNQMKKAQINLVTNAPLTIEESVQKSLIQQLIEQRMLLLTVPSRAYQESLFKWLSHEFPKKNIRMLLKNKDFLNQPAFEKLVNQYDFEKVNHHELILIAAIIVWLNETNTGRLNELNPELAIDPLLNKYLDDVDRLNNRAFYRQHLEELKHADVIISENYYFHQLINRKNSPIQGLCFKRTLVDLDSADTLASIRYLAEHHINISDWFVSLRADLNALSHEIKQASTREKLSELLNILTKALYELQNFLTNQFHEQGQLRENQLNTYRVMAESVAPIKQYLTHIRRVSQLIVEEFRAYCLKQSVNESTLKLNSLRYLLSIVNQMLVTHPKEYWICEAQYMNRQFFQINLRKGRTLVDSQTFNYLKQFDDCVIFDLNQQLIEIEQQLIGYPLHSIALPKIHSENPLNLVAPITYMTAPQDQQRWDTVKEFIENLPSTETQTILLLTTNYTDVRVAYEHLSHLPPPFMVWANGINGSLRRVKRQAIDMNHSIVIMNFREMMREGWSLTETPVTVLLLQIPFLSSDHPFLQIDNGFKGLPAEKLFQNKILPQTIGELSGLFDYSINWLSIQRFYLLDARFYSESYSQVIRKELKRQLSFNEKVL